MGETAVDHASAKRHYNAVGKMTLLRRCVVRCVCDVHVAPSLQARAAEAMRK